MQQLRAGFWGIDLILTAVAVFFLVKAVQYLFVTPITEPAALSVPSASNAPATDPRINSYEKYAALRNSNLFGALSSANVAAQKVEEEKLPETTLELELLGCVSAPEPELSFAIIRDKRGRTEDTYGVGDSIVSDARVEEIRESEVVISRMGQREVLAMSFTEQSPLISSANPFRSMRPTSFPGSFQLPQTSQESAIRVVNENMRYINRAKLMEEVGSNLGQIMNQFRTSPNTVGNKPAGLRIDQLGNDPLAGQSGIQPGDIIKSVNGVRVNSMNDLLGQSDRLQKSPEIRVVVERDGRHRTLVYKIR